MKEPKTSQLSRAKKSSHPPESSTSKPNAHPPAQSSFMAWRHHTFDPLRRFHKFLDRLFRVLGCHVAQYPSYFILFPVFFSLLGVTGFQQVSFEDNPELLFYPATGPAPKERRVIEEHFPMNYSDSFLPHHMTRPSGFARVLVSAKRNGTVFTERFFDDVKQMDKFIKSISITYKGKNMSYNDLCARWNDKCFQNKVMALEPLIPEIEAGKFHVNYPVMLYPLIMPMDFGGMEVDEKEGIIKSANSVSLNYFLKENTEEEKELSLVWEQKFLDTIQNLKLKNADFAFFAARSRKDEMLNNTNAIKPYSVATGLLIVFFSIGSIFTADWVRGKMLLGIVGVASAGMATGTAFGVLMYLGVPFISINKVIPFLMIGIGIDDMFVVLASWRRTRIQDPVSKRLSETYSEAGISITITSLTNMLSFSVGITTPILGVQIFCIYTTLSVLLTYLWHLTFFGGCLALAGFLESNQRHSIICIKVKAKSEADREGRTCYRIWCGGGVAKDDAWNEKDNRPHIVMVAFRDYFGKFLSIPVVKGAVLCLFLLYLGGAIYGCLTLEEGLDRKHVVQYNSYATDYYNLENQQFRKFPYTIQVILTGDIRYSNPLTKQKIMKLHEKFESLPFTAENIFTQSWIRRWYRFIDSNSSLRRGISDEKTFIRYLRTEFLSPPTNHMALDVEFNRDYSRITASRITFQTYEITNTKKESAMVEAFRKVAEESVFNVTVFNPNFILFDQYTMVQPITIQAVSIAVVAMVIVSLIFIPNPWCSLLVGMAIISIEIGVVGYMSLWGVNLDQISMINLIMCIGFSVDFSAHISYAYLTAKVNTAEGKIRECLYSLGLPILQGGLSTLVCIITFILAPSYVYVTFFKIVFLVVLFATVHGLLLIPVLLSMFGTSSTTKKDLTNANIKIPRVKLTSNDVIIDFDGQEPPQKKREKKKKRYPNYPAEFCHQGHKNSSGNRPDPEGCSNRSFGKENEKPELKDR